MREQDLTVRIYLYDYKNTADIKRLKDYDESAVRYLERLEEAARDVKAYRQELYKHTQALQEMKSRLQLKLERRRNNAENKVFYYVTLDRIYTDTMQESLIFESFTGQDRAKAFARFETLKKQYVGIEYIKQTEKGKWER